jgi:two-component system CheB/CheR fusion protein
MSARSATTPKELATSIRGRLDALSAAHELVLPHETGRAAATAQSIHLDSLLQKILAPYSVPRHDGSHGRLAINGPAVAIGTRAVTSFALVLHEIATNAAKYGALSVPEGSVNIAWSARNDILLMKWEERGGPALSGPPKAEGFGTTLSNHSVQRQFQGTISYRWNSGGLVVELSIPLERLRD